MSQARIYNLTDPDLPESLHHVRRIFLRPTFGMKLPKGSSLSGYQKAKLAAEAIKQKLGQKTHQTEQLTFYGQPIAQRINRPIGGQK